LREVDYGPKSAVTQGALLRLSGRYFVIAVSTSKFTCDGREVMGISTMAPMTCPPTFSQGKLESSADWVRFEHPTQWDRARSPQIARAPCPIARSDRASLPRRSVASASPGSNEAARCCSRSASFQGAHGHAAASGTGSRSTTRRAPAIEGFDEGVLDRLARCDVMPADPFPVRPRPGSRSRSARCRCRR